MYEKFSSRVEAIVKTARQIAREYGQEYVGTEHLMLAVMRDGDGIAAKVLADRGVTELGLKAEVDRLIRKSMEDTWVFGRLPGTPHLKNVVKTAVEQARQLESKEVCTEHLLLAILREKGSVAQAALDRLGIRYDDVQPEIATILGEAS